MNKDIDWLLIGYNVIMLVVKLSHGDLTYHSTQSRAAGTCCQGKKTSSPDCYFFKVDYYCYMGSLLQRAKVAEGRFPSGRRDLRLYCTLSKVGIRP